MRMAIHERPRLSSMPQWLIGFGLFVLGTAMSFGAFKFAAQSLLSGLGSVQFISQVCFSRFVLHEKIERHSYVGVVLICVGCTLLVIFGAHETKNYKPEELAALYGRSEYVCYVLGAGFLACTVSLAYSILKQRIMREKGIGRFDVAKASVQQRQILAALFSVKSALFGSQAVVLAKSLSMLLIQALHPSPAYSNPLYSYQTYFIVLGFAAAATFWVTRLNHGLRSFEAVYFIPMMQICWIIFSTVAGGIYYEEFIGFGSKEYGAYAAGFLGVLIGVAMLCPRDDVSSFNAADVIYEIVTDENLRAHTMSPRPIARFDAFDVDEEARAAEAAELGQLALSKGRNGHRKSRVQSNNRGYEQLGAGDSEDDDSSGGNRRGDTVSTAKEGEAVFSTPSDASVSDRVQRLQAARSNASFKSLD
jgi:Magnesium transporter NIPA